MGLQFFSFEFDYSNGNGYGNGQSKSFRALRDFLLSWQKEALRSEAKRTAKPARRASAQREVKPFEPDASRCGGAASVPCAPRGRRHGAQTRCAQTRAPLRPPAAAVLGSLYGSAGRECNDNGNGKSKSRARAFAQGAKALAVAFACPAESAIGEY